MQGETWTKLERCTRLALGSLGTVHALLMLEPPTQHLALILSLTFALLPEYVRSSSGNGGCEDC